ncbi:TetR/AcrR family transcriptional regulator [Phyllobacterium sp. 628]|uniref:TetR/AcrR family transcriptional regulator n=1 Tax=Phyllobacterium sp. 628 TaxID=2718938 RepID=UPI0016622B57|nr:TetR/AcrR family transcriptional regulator [Phyllobacterium sp. 628]QND52472.1 TetR/AcrR family transcriptional regulator [Phyllobacterium sp. 628]
MADNHLGPAEWVSAGLAALESSGFTALKADKLAKVLNVSRGSFYWHFADVAAFHTAVLRHWRAVALEGVVNEIGHTNADRLEALLERAFLADTRREVAVRAWATADPLAKSIVDSVDIERVSYLRKLLVESGIEPVLAETRAQILNWTYLGHALSTPGSGHQSVHAAICDLSQMMRK